MTKPQRSGLPLHGLAPATLYHYRLQATNTYGTTYGADETFTTPSLPNGHHRCADWCVTDTCSGVHATVNEQGHDQGHDQISKNQRRNRKKRTGKKHQKYPQG